MVAMEEAVEITVTTIKKCAYLYMVPEVDDKYFQVLHSKYLRVHQVVATSMEFTFLHLAHCILSFRAADWNKEAIWTGRLRVVEKGGFIR